jgi:hypothetical protein
LQDFFQKILDAACGMLNAKWAGCELSATRWKRNSKHKIRNPKQTNNDAMFKTPKNDTGGSRADLGHYPFDF